MDSPLSFLPSWYANHRRDLPWRETRDPYLIWISEVILQQTRVAQGMDYYLRFTERFADVAALAAASEEEVLKYWQGLGYYSRARNLHKAAQQVMQWYGGKFPADYASIRKLAGIGDYTAAAIASFAFDLPYAVVDGNVYRVLSRIFGIETPIDSTEGVKQFRALAQEVLDTSHPALHNQAIMEFGALQCVPASPNCAICPALQCSARDTNNISALPVKSKKTAVKELYFNYLFIHSEEAALLQKRTQGNIWRNMYEFPLIETTTLTEPELLFQNEDFLKLMGASTFHVNSISPLMKHVLTHRRIFARFISIEVVDWTPSMQQYLRVPLRELERYPVSRLMSLFLDTL